MFTVCYCVISVYCRVSNRDCVCVYVCLYAAVFIKPVHFPVIMMGNFFHPKTQNDDHFF